MHHHNTHTWPPSLHRKRKVTNVYVRGRCYRLYVNLNIFPFFKVVYAIRHSVHNSYSLNMLVHLMCHTLQNHTHYSNTLITKHRHLLVRTNRSCLTYLPARALYRPRLLGPFELSGMTDTEGTECCHLLCTCENAPTKSNL